ncbi:MAG TPA: RNA methyltransferase [Sandaracinaceae bacterium LLY-WYZ-13_1]|nr:RNA methyltransferase [Sandaracinaceae bacterium LLY-WYZ-13_1]
MSAVYVALVHHPVRDRAGDTITTAVTNLDVHDLARSARTYDVDGYFVVVPLEVQRQLVQRILDHWREGAGARRVPERSEALRICEPLASLEDAREAVVAREGRAPLVVATGARPPAGVEPTGYAEARARMAEEPSLVLFGTGHGLARSVVDAADLVLAPIRPGASYNHLSVRAAAAITLDRLFGDERA